MVICLKRSADLHIAQLMPLPLTVSCFSKIQIGFRLPLWYPLTRVLPDKGPLNGCVCVCFVLCYHYDHHHQQQQPQSSQDVMRDTSRPVIEVISTVESVTRPPAKRSFDDHQSASQLLHCQPRAVLDARLKAASLTDNNTAPGDWQDAHTGWAKRSGATGSWP